MATFGAVNNTTVENVETSFAVRFSGGTLPVAGTLTEFHVWLQSGFPGTESWRLAVYQGGSATDPSGATLIWDSGQLNVNISASAWTTATTMGATPSGSLAAAYTWLMVKLNDGQIALNESDRGDFDSGSYRSTAVSGDASVAYPATWPSDTTHTGAEAIKAFITYTEGGGGATLRKNSLMRLNVGR